MTFNQLQTVINNFHAPIKNDLLNQINKEADKDAYHLPLPVLSAPVDEMCRLVTPRSFTDPKMQTAAVNSGRCSSKFNDGLEVPCYLFLDPLH